MNRRKFVTASSLAFIGLSMPLNALNNITKDYLTLDNIPQLLKKAANKRRNGKLAQAQSFYNQVISIDPNEVRAYDGIRKILLQSKYKELDVLNLYLNRLNQVPTNPIFQERVAKEYMRLSLGNKKFVNQLNSSTDLLELSKSLFNQAKNQNPDNSQFQKQFQKAKRKQNQNASTIDARVNVDLKFFKKSKKQEFKKRFKDLSSSETENKLNLLLNKPITTFRSKHIKEIYRILIIKLKKENNINQAKQKIADLYQFDKTDQNTLLIARRILKKHSKWGVLENIERQNNALKNTFWSNISLFDVLLIRYKKNGVGSVSEMQSVLNVSQSLINTPIQYFEVNSRKLKLAYEQNDFLNAKSILISFADSIEGISSAHYIDRFNIICARYFKKMSDIGKALLVISIALKEINKEPEDELLRKIYFVNNGKEIIKIIHNNRLNNFRNKLLSNQID